MNKKFKMFDNLVSIWEPDKIGVVINIDTIYHGNRDNPVYTIEYPDGNMYAGYESSFRKVDKNENLD